MDKIMITSNEVRSILKDGTFKTILFTKKDGTDRQITGRTGVSKFVTGEGKKFSDEDKGLVTLWIPESSRKTEHKNDKGYRNILISSIKEIHAKRKTYVLGE